VTYRVQTPVFDGPLELLLHLITSRQVEVTQISLSDLVDGYLAHLEMIRRLDLDATSEFLVIAATLIQMKARRLLPGDTGVDLDEEALLAEERDRLLSRLLACLTFKDVAAVMAHRMEAQGVFLGRTGGLDPGIHPAPPEVVIGTDPAGLAALAARVIGRRREPDLDHLDLDLPSVAMAIEDVRHRVAAGVDTDFDAITAHCKRSVEVVAYFLAVLELARWGLVRASQDHLDAAIRITRIEAPAGEALVSEWEG